MNIILKIIYSFTTVHVFMIGCFAQDFLTFSKKPRTLNIIDMKRNDMFENIL